jgi:cell division protein DivIC
LKCPLLVERAGRFIAAGVNGHRFIVFLYVVLISGLGLGAGALFLDARAEFIQLKKVQDANEAKLAAAEARLREQEQILKRLRSDPTYVEKVLRQRGYARPNDVIIRFDAGF